MAAPAGQPQTIAEPFLTTLTAGHVTLPLNPDVAFRRAIKVFMMSYAGFEAIAPQLYRQKFNEFRQSMRYLYNINHPYDHIDEELLGTVSNETIQLSVSVIDIYEDLPQNQWITTTINIQIVDNLVECLTIPMPTSRGVQQDIGHTKTLTYLQLVGYRQSNRHIVIQLNDSNLYDLNQFRISYRDIHAEGYEDWFDFGCGLRMLIKISFRVMAEAATQQDIANYHLKTVLNMIQQRLEHFRRNPINTYSQHREFAHKVKMSYIRSTVDPNTVEAYWPPPPVTSITDLAERVRQETNEDNYHQYIKDKILRKTILYCDLQIGFRQWFHYKDTVCLCSEWCNWSAFFHFNPIYRFLLVQHNQLYLTNATNIPDIYLCVSTLMAKHLSGQPVIPKSPIFRLIYCANDYQNRFYNEVYLKCPQYCGEHNMSLPSLLGLIGLSYKSLRFDINSTPFRHQLSLNPLSSLCVEDFRNYVNLMKQLHDSVSKKDVFVRPKNLRQFEAELSAFLTEHYGNYVVLSYRQMLRKNTPLGVSDQLLTKDIEYPTPHVTDGHDLEILENLKNVIKSDNPFNFRIKTNCFLTVFISLYKVFVRVDPMIPKANEDVVYYNLLDFCAQFDTDFVNYDQIVDPNTGHKVHSLDFDFVTQMNDNWVTKTRTALYTMKVYSYAFVIQGYCIKSVVKLTKGHFSGRIQTADEFNFIWFVDQIETTFRRKYPNERLFGLNDNIQQSIDKFYTDFWGKADHQNPTVQPLDFERFVSSAYFEYQRLYFWWQNNGNSRHIFTNILHNFMDNFEQNFRASEDMFKVYIIDYMMQLSPDCQYMTETMDQLVCYLVKANCYVILSIVSTFLSNMYRVIEFFVTTADPIVRRLNYPLCKPGWVHIFRTMRQVYDIVDQLKAYYIVYDNHLSKITDTLTQTKARIKSIYRQMFTRIGYEWVVELELIHANPIQSPNVYNLQCLHIAVGLSFVTTFIDDFRYESAYYRKQLVVVKGHQGNPHNAANTAFNDCFVTWNRFLRDKKAIKNALPFFSTHWNSLLNNIFQDFNQNDANYLNIDLSKAQT